MTSSMWVPRGCGGHTLERASGTSVLSTMRRGRCFCTGMNSDRTSTVSACRSRRGAAHPDSRPTAWQRHVIYGLRPRRIEIKLKYSSTRVLQSGQTMTQLLHLLQELQSVRTADCRGLSVPQNGIIGEHNRWWGRGSRDRRIQRHYDLRPLRIAFDCLYLQNGIH
jgi:hypothetical protein